VAVPEAQKSIEHCNVQMARTISRMRLTSRSLLHRPLRVTTRSGWKTLFVKLYRTISRSLSYLIVTSLPRFTNSSNFTNVPPKMSRELNLYQNHKNLINCALAAYLPYVRSTRPFDNVWTSSRSSKAIAYYRPCSISIRCNIHFAPPAYVVGIVTHSPSSVQRDCP
jgi:hypothetical protein